MIKQYEKEITRTGNSIGIASVDTLARLGCIIYLTHLVITDSNKVRVMFRNERGFETNYDEDPSTNNPDVYFYCNCRFTKSVCNTSSFINCNSNDSDSCNNFTFTDNNNSDVIEQENNNTINNYFKKNFYIYFYSLYCTSHNGNNKSRTC